MDGDRTMLVFVASGADGQLSAARDVLAAWASAGMLEPFCWWTVGDSALLERFDASGAHPTTPGEALRSVKRYRPVFVERPGGARIAATDDRLVREELRLAAATGSPPPVAHHLLVPDHLAAATEAEQRDAGSGDTELSDRLERTNEPIVIVVPEDRSNPEDANLFGKGDRYGAHVAQAIATLGGRWRSAGGPLASEVLDAPGGPMATAVAVRTFSRVIEAGHLPDLLAAGAVRFDGRWPVPDPVELSALAEEFADETVQQLAERFTTKHRRFLIGDPFPPIALREREPITLLLALRRIGQAILALVRSWPIQKFESMVAGAYEAARARVQDAADRFTGDRIVGWEDDQPVGGGWTLEAADRSRVRVDGPVAMAWRDYGQLAFSLIDGSDLPQGIDHAELCVGERRALVFDLPHSIAPRPVRSGVAASHASNRICDPLSADPDLAGDQAVPIEPGRLARARRSLCWAVGLRIGAALQHATKRATEAVDEVQAAETRAAELAEAFEPAVGRLASAMRAIRWVVLAIAVGGAVLLWAPADYRITRLALIGAGAFVVLVLASLRIERRKRALVEALAEAKAEVDRSMRELRYWTDHAKGMKFRYREYLDWSDVIAELVHEPWKVPDLEPPEPSAFAACPRPEATQFAVGSYTETSIVGKISTVRNGLFDRSWLVGWFARVRAEAMDRLHDELGLDDDAGLAILDPWADLSTREMGARRYLRRYVREGTGRTFAASPVADRVRASINAVPLADLLSGVRPVGAPGAEPSRPGPGDAVVRLKVSGPDGEALGSGVVLTEGGVTLTNRHVVAGASRIEMQFADADEWVPARLLATSELVDLAAVHPLLPVERQGTVRLASEAHAGTAVTCTGFPEQIDGSAVTVDGTLTGLRHLVTVGGAPSALSTFKLASAPGSSGSGICDADGDLISILVGGSTRSEMEHLPDYLTVGVPLDDVREFLADLAAAGELELPLDFGRWVDLTSEGIEPVDAFLAPIRDADAHAGAFLPDNFRGYEPLPISAAVLPEAARFTDAQLRATDDAPVRLVHVRIEATTPSPLGRFNVPGLDRSRSQDSGGGEPAEPTQTPATEPPSVPPI